MNVVRSGYTRIATLVLDFWMETTHACYAVGYCRTDQRALRHRGAMNVLFVDGHVETRMPSDIDPDVTVNQEMLWRPTKYKR